MGKQIENYEGQFSKLKNNFSKVSEDFKVLSLTKSPEAISTNSMAFSKAKMAEIQFR